MTVTHTSDRYTIIKFGDGIVATWKQPQNQSLLPECVKQIIQDSAQGDYLAIAERTYLRWHRQLTVK